VAGFFAIKGRFPLGLGFILRVKKATFLREEPGTVDSGNRSVINDEHLLRYGHSRRRYTPWTVGGRRIYREVGGWVAYWVGIPGGGR